MPTKSRSKRKRVLAFDRIRSPLTPIQKFREMVLLLLGVEKQDIERAKDLGRGLVSNVIYDRHRSPGTERAIVDYLNGKIESADAWTLQMLRNIGGGGGAILEPYELTLDMMGWPEPAPRSSEP